MTAYEYLKRLQSEVGARRAGTKGELQARAWITDRLEEIGLEVEEREYRFVGSRAVRYFVAWVRNLLLVLFLILSRHANPIITLGGLLLFMLYFSRYHPNFMLRLARTKSQNLIAGLNKKFGDKDERDDRPIILICAHYDTPQNIPGWILSMLDILRVLGPVLNLTLLAALALLLFGGVLSALETFFGIGGTALQAVGDIWAAVGFWILLSIFGFQLLLISIYILDLVIREHGDSPGADDNGSGVSLVLAMAERLKAKPPKHADVFFAFWGAEELGLYGSRQFVRQHGDSLDKESTYIVNADVVGVSENLLIHTGQGVIFRRRTEPEIVEALEEICDERDVPHTRSWESLISGGSSDHAEWAERGFNKAISLLREKPKAPSLPARLLAWVLRIPDPNQFEIDHVHTDKDTIEVIRPEVLQETVGICEQYVRWIDDRVRRASDSPTSTTEPATGS